MENSKPILTDGAGTPYMAVFNGNGSPIIDPKSNMPIGMLITSWYYEFDEEKSDTAEITINTDNPNLIDIPELRRLMSLILQWGWLLPDGTHISSNPRKVKIVDHKLGFDDNGIKLTIECESPFGLARSSQADPSEKTFLDFVKNNITGQFTFEVIDNTITPTAYLTKVDKPKSNGQKGK